MNNQLSGGQTMPVYDIDAPGGVVRFAKIFIRRRLKGFKKDMKVCLRPGWCENEERAFMPALGNAIALLELFSGLYTGRVTYRNEAHLIRYLNAFAPGRYREYDLKVLYIVFRHKLAHLSHPYFGFNTATHDELETRPMRLAWSITSDPRDEAIKITKRPRSKFIRRQPTPWRVRVDHVIEISIQTIADDAIKAAANYLAALKMDVELQAKFRACMNDFYQT